jgi:hypothetical protein
MKTKFQTYHLNSTANAYFAERLTEGLTLSKHLKKFVDLTKGKVNTFAPANLSHEQLHAFNGCILNEDIPENGIQAIDNKLTTEWLVEKIKSFLAESKNNYCIFERPDDYPQNGVIPRFPFWNVLYKDGEPYYILGYNDSKENILEAIMQNTSYSPLGMGIFTKIENINSYFSDKDHLGKEDFFKIAAESTEKIYIQAYDHEGYLLWENS